MSKEPANRSVEKESSGPQDARILSHNADGSHSESESEQSVASTIQYASAGHIPFERFRDQVAGFFALNWPEYSVLDTFHIKGGAYNLIIGIKLKHMHSLGCSYDKPPVEEYILRMTRGTAAKDLDSHHQEAIYDTVRKLIRIPVPKIILADSSSDHDFGRPFTIQERLPGQQLYQMWFHLNHKQKLSIARQLGEYFSQVRHVPYTKGGTIRSTLSNSCAIFEHSFGNPFVVNDPNGDETVLAKSCSTIDLIEARIQRWEELDVDGLFPWHVLFRMLKDADNNHGALKPENSYYLTHNDFHLRNMLSIIIDDTEVKITGILDWEGAEFAPAIVALELPCYLWQSDTDEDSRDDNAARVLYCKEPIDDKLKEIKQTFDYYAARNLEATPDVSFCAYAYHPDAGFVREAWKWITKGLFDDEDIKSLDHVATHWQKIHEMEEGGGHQGEGVEAWVFVNPKDV